MGVWPVCSWGVPIFACFYAGVRAYSAYRLSKKGLPVSSASYATHKPVWPEEPTVPPEEEKPGNP